MKKKLKPQLKNTAEIKSILQQVQVSFEYGEDQIETILVYLPFKDGACDYSNLFRVIKEHIMMNFALSYSEITAKLSIRKKDKPEDLFKKSVRKLSKHTAKGELGELLLFTLLDVYFQAPKILSKISLKTSRRMPVYGADAVHAQFIDNSLRLYLGESKLHKNFSGAAASAVKSISNAVKQYDDEFDSIDSNIDFPEIDETVKYELLDLLNPFSSTPFDSELLYTPCFIGFTDPSVFSDNTKNYIDNYIDLAEEHITDFYSKLEKKGNNINKTALMLLPFSSIDDFVKDFITYMGIKK